MSNDSSPVGSAHGFDSDALEEWVSETARQKGVSKQKLLDEILSSYWVLEELSGVVTDSDVTNETRQSETQPAVDSGSRRPEAAGDGEVENTGSGASSTVEFSELKSELQGLRTAIEELSREQQTDEETEDDAVDPGISALAGQLDELSSAVVDRQTETDEVVTELSERIETLNERLTAVESRLDEGMSLSELEAAVEASNDDQAQLEDRLESEFDSIEQVLQHLLDTTDNIEYRLGAVSESRQEALRPIRQQHAIHEELVELKQEALRHEISSGVCDNCDQQIDLGLLEKPECPSCERRFTGMKKSGWFSFAKAKLQTTDRPRRTTDQQWSSNGTDTTGESRETNSPDSYQTNW